MHNKVEVFWEGHKNLTKSAMYIPVQLRLHLNFHIHILALNQPCGADSANYCRSCTKKFLLIHLWRWMCQSLWPSQNIWTLQLQNAFRTQFGKNVLHECLEGIRRLVEIAVLGKVIYTKYSKHWPYTVAHTIECVCRKC